MLFFGFGATPASYSQAIDQPPVLSRFPFEESIPLKIVREAVPSKPFTVVGPRGAILGLQDGSFETWVFPWKSSPPTGTRDLSPTVSFYDPISYHQGSVWPLFTGWVSVSEYHNGRWRSAQCKDVSHLAFTCP